MKRTFLKTVAVALATMAAGSAFAADITGAGATFPFPMYAKWAEAYKKETGTGLNYQSIGSSGGIRQIRAKTVAFGATDAPVSGADLDKDGMVQFPAIIGGTVPVINLEGFKPGELRVTGPVLADLFLLWVLAGMLMGLGYLPVVDLGYSWFSNALSQFAQRFA